MDANSEIIATLNGLYNKTVENKIQWTVINQNAIRWVKPATATGVMISPSNSIVTLQMQPNPNPALGATYILTIQEGSVAALQINTSVDGYAKSILAKLYEQGRIAATREESEKKAQILKKLLDGIG